MLRVGLVAALGLVACLLENVGGHAVMFHGLCVMPFMITVEAL